MKRLILSLICAATVLGIQAQWRRNLTPADTLKSIQRLADGSTAFRIYAPKSESVELGGDQAGLRAQFQKDGDAGYTYINLDDCWHGERDADGFIQADAKRFPSGIKALADHVHARGQQLSTRLTRLAKKGIMFGHQDAPFYGLGWSYEEGRSDVRDLVGDYPAVMGFELGGIEVGDEKNLDSVPFQVMRREILAQHRRGGIVTISWRPRNPLTGGTAWVNGEERGKNTVAAVLPGGNVHGVFEIWLGRLTAFLASLKDEQGHPIPFIFRPWHENSGGWFWWGRGLCSAEEYKALWNMTQDFVARSLPYNILWSWSPNYGFEPDVLDTYPGHDRVDLIGLDAYQQPGGEEAFVSQLNKDLATLCKLAQEGKRLVALTECGYQNIPDATWWTRVLKPQIEKYPISYFLVWRNADRRQYFAPAPDTKDAPDFRKMVEDKRILMLKDIAKK